MPAQSMICWRCQVRPVTRLRLKPWKRSALCRQCTSEIDKALLSFIAVVIAIYP
jgi:hypothetical protein